MRYRHNGDVESVRDRVLFRVSAGSTVSRELEFDIRLLPQHYWEPLEVTKNSPIIVDESTTIAVTKQYIEVKIIIKFTFSLKLTRLFNIHLYLYSYQLQPIKFNLFHKYILRNVVSY